ncbi:MAG TPA: hypothetical protein VF950_15490 [Planctomycetota bacterium]
MSFEKWVQKSTKGLFLFIAIAMIVPLVLWGNYGGGGDDDAKQGEVVGTIFETVPVHKRELDRMTSRAMVDWWWKQYTGPNAWMMRFKKPDPPKDEELVKLAWENLVLLEDAKMKGITATEKEVNDRFRDLYNQLTGGQQTQGADEILAGRVNEIFHSNLTAFEGWVGDIVVIDKLLQAVADASFESYEDVYSQMSRDHVLAKAWYAGVDPKNFEKNARPSTSDEIARRYEQNKAKYKVPAKAVVTALAANMEAYKKAVAEPTEADIRKYYDEHKAEYLLPHEHAPGEEHKENEAPKYTSFDQAKAEIPEKIRTEKAKETARELMAKVDRALGEMFDAATKSYPADAFEKLKAKFKDQGPELSHDVLPKFGARDVDELEKSIGTGSNLGSWSFDPKTVKGSVSRVTSTTKGVYLFRLMEKVDGYDTGVTERVRESIERDLAKEQVRTRASKEASRLSREISAKGLTAAARTTSAEWGVTRYFKTKNPAETGIEDRQLSQAVASQAASLTPGKTGVVAGSQAGKPDWSYVVYLEDVIPAAPENPEAEFTAARNRLDDEKRRKAREEYPRKRVDEARIRLGGDAPKS